MRRHAHEPFIDESSSMPISSKRLMHGMKYMRASNLDPQLRTVFLSYLFWYAAHDAAAQSLWETSWNILRILQQKIDQSVGLSAATTAGVASNGPSDDHSPPPGSPSSSTPSSALTFPYNSDDLFMQELVCRLCGGERIQSLTMIEDLLRRSSPAAYGTGNIGVNQRSGEGMSSEGMSGGGSGSGSGRMKERGSLVLTDDVIATLTRLEKTIVAETNASGDDKPCILYYYIPIYYILPTYK